MGIHADELVILIADRNPRVRDFLRREMVREGYRVFIAESAAELLAGGVIPAAPHLVIVDPDYPGTEVAVLLRELRRRFPCARIVVHTHDPVPEEIAACGALRLACDVVEKAASSIEALKALASDLIAGRPSGGKPSGSPAP